MKTNVVLIAILVLGSIFTSCEKEDLFVSPSTEVTFEQVPVSSISKLEVEDVFQVYVSFSETEESVVVEASKNLHSVIEVEQRGETLVVGLDENVQISGDPVLNIYVTTSTIDKVVVSGACTVDFENPLVTNTLDIQITGASKLTGVIDVESLHAKLYGASILELSGTSNSFDIDAEGASKMTGFDFETNSLNADLMGGSDISLSVNQKLNIIASGASKVYYKGNSVIESQNLSDASEIIDAN
ncbi:head GIN domain-containing protein [Sunxiuqinia sp. A32]|uniref:head GIN domain-containing protein n=1 Tax=Sunxiuqinia sp. A32 TaxID=3461496 RepID=UPI00404683A2